jgi:hypothetical protein
MSSIIRMRLIRGLWHLLSPLLMMLSFKVSSFDLFPRVKLISSQSPRLWSTITCIHQFVRDHHIHLAHSPSLFLGN